MSAIADAVQNAPSDVEDTTEMFMPQLTSNPSIIRSSLSSSPVPPTSSATLTYTLLNRSRAPMIFSSSSPSFSTSTPPPKPQRPAAVVVSLRPISSSTSTTIRPSVPTLTKKTNPTIQAKNNSQPTTTSKSVLLTGLNQTRSNVTWIANSKPTSQLVTSNTTSLDDADYEYYDYDETTLQTSQSTTAIAKTSSTTKTLTSTARAITSPPVQVTTLTVRQDLERQVTTSTTTKATTTTQSPFVTTTTAPPNVGILNALTRAGGAGISIGIASAAYAAIALFGIPFIGRRRRSVNDRNWLFASDYNPDYRHPWMEVVDN
ncbi:hypothetical protein GHT06_009820 [Daphnia sinensis]|uniref:Uncharacterized protein n=1 Tax=Daphnia sinensis TaxID=1820382 RepID=A0AAD5LNK3_9CRUS|nr:hypothetical protein GHT06_009820 [Daphnia sinensis]